VWWFFYCSSDRLPAAVHLRIVQEIAAAMAALSASEPEIQTTPLADLGEPAHSLRNSNRTRLYGIIDMNAFPSALAQCKSENSASACTAANDGKPTWRISSYCSRRQAYVCDLKHFNSLRTPQGLPGRSAFVGASGLFRGGIRYFFRGFNPFSSSALLLETACNLWCRCPETARGPLRRASPSLPRCAC